MRRSLIPGLVLAMLWAGSVGAPAQDTTMTDTTTTTEEITASVLPYSSARLYAWTTKLGFLTTDRVTAYVTLDPMDDTAEYTLFVYRQNIETGERQYASPGSTTSSGLQDGVVDYWGNASGSYQVGALTALDQSQLWAGSQTSPGLWQFVVELRSADTTQVVKRAYAKYVVSALPPIEYGTDGTDTEISTDTTWTNDTLYRIRYQVFVNSGATLTIEPGTHILARGQNAVIVVEKGGKIIADGRREAPIVMTCDADIGERYSGCWGGLILLGDAPMTRGTGHAEGVIPETRPVYGGSNSEDSSGVLRYVRVEFAGVNFNPETQPNGFGFHGVGSGTIIDHIQAHEGEDDGIEFFGGSANCTYCVSSGAKDDSLDWAFGWNGTAQYVYIHQDPDGDNGIEADNDSSGFDRTPRSSPQIYNMTMIGGLQADEFSAHGGDGMRLRRGTQVTVRNLVMSGFGGEALDVRDNSPSFFMSGDSSIKNAIITNNAGMTGDSQFSEGIATHVGYEHVAPMLTNVRYEGNPDPRPMLGSPALEAGAGSSPPSDGALDTSADFVGAFGSVNWLEEWTFFGDEGDYEVETTTTTTTTTGQ